MPGRKKSDLVESISYEEAHKRLIETMKTLHISRIEEMPHIDLYLDQLLSIISTELAPLYGNGEKIVTGSMVNNYVKQRVVPAPTRRRYTSKHLASLIIFCALKRVLSISQISQILSLCQEEGFDPARIYNTLVCAFERAIALRFAGFDSGAADIGDTQDDLIRSLVNEQGQPMEPKLVTLLESAVSLLANKVFVERLLALDELRRRELEQEE